MCYEPHLRQNEGVNDEDWMRLWEETEDTDPLSLALTSTLEKFRKLPAQEIGIELHGLIHDPRLEVLAFQQLRTTRDVDEAISRAAGILAKLDSITDRRRQPPADQD